MVEMRALLLSAGVGKRLRPLTDQWPKCLMPVQRKPLLEYWLFRLQALGISKILVNLHHHASDVQKFLSRPCFEERVTSTYEPMLLGTAGTLISNQQFFKGSRILLIHADNWCQCDFSDFVHFHYHRRPLHCPITMMTFDTLTPETCGIVKTDAHGVVVEFYEKIPDAPGTTANGAVYIMEPEVLDWLCTQPLKRDFSTDVLPHFVGRIATWHNHEVHRDIGTPRMLKLAQLDPRRDLLTTEDDWQLEFEQHPIHSQMRTVFELN